MNQPMWVMLAVGAGVILWRMSQQSPGAPARQGDGGGPGPVLLPLAGDRGDSVLWSDPFGAFGGGGDPGGGSPDDGTLVYAVGAPSDIQTADEDIGFAPAATVAAKGFNQVAEAAGVPEAIIVGPSSAPVISQAPNRVEVTLISPEDAVSGSYSLGVPAGAQLTGTTPILISEFGTEPGGGGQPLSTTPTVLGAYLAGFDTVAEYQAALAA